MPEIVPIMLTPENLDDEWFGESEEKLSSVLHSFQNKVAILKKTQYFK